MTKGLQRRIIAQELTSCGFRLTMSDTTLEAVTLAVRNPPDAILTSHEMEDLDGMGWDGIGPAQVLARVTATQDTRIAVMARLESQDQRDLRLPAGVQMIRKDDGFFETLKECLVDWGFFGRLSASA